MERTWKMKWKLGLCRGFKAVTISKWTQELQKNGFRARDEGIYRGTIGIIIYGYMSYSLNSLKGVI